jgi:flagellar biosynthesis GTPase FlhF
MSEETRTYRGDSLEDVLPRIRAELGENAVITRQREGIVGGVGGFFGKKMVEVEARAASSGGFDVYDEEPAAESALLQELYRQAKPFAEHLDEHLETALDPAPAPEHREDEAVLFEPMPDTPPEPEHVSSATEAETVRAALARAGVPRPVVEAVLSEIEAHLRPFDQVEPLADQARRALARRIRVKHGWRTQRRTIALVGPEGAGRTLTAAKLCHAYASGTDLAVAALSMEHARKAMRLGTLTELVDVGLEIADDPHTVPVARRRLAKSRLVVADTPPVEVGDFGSIGRVGALLDALRPDETHLVVPAALEAQAVRLLLHDLQARTRVDRLLVTHSDEPLAAGGAVGASLAAKIPVSYVGAGRLPVSGLRPAEPDELARLVLQ